MGQVSGPVRQIDYDCPRCGYEAKLPVNGIAIAQTSYGAVIFDAKPYAMPMTIQCRKCRRVYTNEPEDADVR